MRESPDVEPDYIVWKNSEGYWLRHPETDEDIRAGKTFLEAVNLASRINGGCIQIAKGHHDARA